MNNKINQNNPWSIDPFSVLLDLKRHWWNILLMALAGAMLGVVAAILLPGNAYTSSAVYAVLGNSSSPVSNVQNAKRVSTSMISVLGSDALESMVVKDLGGADYKLSASYIADTNLISVKATAATPRLAFLALKSALIHYPALMSNLTSDLYMVTLQAPQIPKTASLSDQLPAKIALGTLLLAGLYCGVVVLLSVLRDTVKNDSDMRQKVDARMIGKIPYLKGDRKKSWVLAAGGPHNFLYEETYQLIANGITTRMEQRGAKTLAITSVLPNEGKSHCLLNLAYSIAKSQKKVLVIDGDFRNPSLGELLNVGEQYDQALSQTIRRGELVPELLYTVPGSSVSYLVNRQKHGGSSKSLSDGRFEMLLQAAKQRFDYILVDTGPTSLVADTAMLASLCDVTVLLVAQDMALVRAVNDSIDILDRNEQMIGCIYRETRPSVERKSSYGYSYGYGYGKVKEQH